MNTIDNIDAPTIIDLTPQLKRMGSPVQGYQDEDGNLHAGMQPDEAGTLPVIGFLDWDGYKSDKANMLDAARAIHKVTKLDKGKWNRAWDKLQGARMPEVQVPTLADWCATMDFPEGDFEWNETESGDAHVYNCGEKDCPVGWHLAYYTMTFKRVSDHVTIYVRSGDSDGNWDYDSGYETGDGDEAWADFYREWLSERNAWGYFRGWAYYHLECAQSRSDPAEAMFNGQDGANPAKHIAAAQDNLKCLEAITKRGIR